MQKVVLIFPNTSRLSDFISDHNISNAEANSKEQSLVADIEKRDVVTAVRDYGGQLNIRTDSI